MRLSVALALEGYLYLLILHAVKTICGEYRKLITCVFSVFSFEIALHPVKEM